MNTKFSMKQLLGILALLVVCLADRCGDTTPVSVPGTVPAPTITIKRTTPAVKMQAVTAAEITTPVTERAGR